MYPKHYTNEGQHTMHAAMQGSSLATSGNQQIHTTISMYALTLQKSNMAINEHGNNHSNDTNWMFIQWLFIQSNIVNEQPFNLESPLESYIVAGRKETCIMRFMREIPSRIRKTSTGTIMDGMEILDDLELVIIQCCAFPGTLCLIF